MFNLDKWLYLTYNAAKVFIPFLNLMIVPGSSGTFVVTPMPFAQISMASSLYSRSSSSMSYELMEQVPGFYNGCDRAVSTPANTGHREFLILIDTNMFYQELLHDRLHMKKIRWLDKRRSALFRKNFLASLAGSPQATLMMSVVG
jgi:hypothetical protein